MPYFPKSFLNNDNIKPQDHGCLLRPALNHLGIFFSPRLDDATDFGAASSSSKTGGFGSSVACATIVDNSGAGTSLPSFNQHSCIM